MVAGALDISISEVGAGAEIMVDTRGVMIPVPVMGVMAAEVVSAEVRSADEAGAEAVGMSEAGAEGAGISVPADISEAGAWIWPSPIWLTIALLGGAGMVAKGGGVSIPGEVISAEEAGVNVSKAAEEDGIIDE